MEFTTTLVAYGAQWALQTLFLFLALWGMVKIQKLQFHLPGLALSAAIASALDLIPFVGHFIAVAVLWVCLTKVTREDFSGVVFTAAISYALVFGMNLFLLGALLGDLRVSAREPAVPCDGLESVSAYEEEFTSGFAMDEDESEEGSSPVTAAASATPDLPAHPQATTVPAATPATPAVKTVPNPVPEPASTAPSAVARAFSIKAIMQNGKNSSAVIHTGVKTYTVFLGDTIFVETVQGAKSLRLDQLEPNLAVLDVAGETVRVVPSPAPR